MRGINQLFDIATCLLRAKFSVDAGGLPNHGEQRQLDSQRPSEVHLVIAEADVLGHGVGANVVAGVDAKNDDPVCYVKKAV